MPLFDAYVMVDWSGRNGRACGRSDCIWIAHGPATATAPETTSPPSRTEAEAVIRSVLQRCVASARGRVLVGADFAYGYPAGFASLLRAAGAGDPPPWRVVWQFLTSKLRDDLGTSPGRRPTNVSNRFEVADAINASAANGRQNGPFWCLHEAGKYPHIPQARPAQPFAARTARIAGWRMADTVAGSDTPFRLFGTGSVGSQALTGIPRLESLRSDPQLSRHSLVWPFETGWAWRTGSWLDRGARILHAEIYPSVRAPLPDTVKDRGQVRAMWHWARDLDARERLVDELSIPPGVVAGAPEDVTIRTEEGWILGAPRHAETPRPGTAGEGPVRRPASPRSGRTPRAGRRRSPRAWRGPSPARSSSA